MPITQFIAAEKYFGMFSPLVVVNKFDNYYEYFLITATKENKKIYDYYFNNVDVIHKITMYFKEKASKIISYCENNRKKLPDEFLESFCIKDKNDPENIRKLLHELEPDTYKVLCSAGHVKLTNKQINCLIGHISGKTAKEIAKELHVSHRTIEHYLENTKDKIRCRTKSDIRALLIANGYRYLLA